MKKFLIYFAFFLAGVVSYLFIFKNEKLPTGSNEAQADSLAQKMLTALNKPAWDSTNVVAWTLNGSHDFIWDKQNQIVQVKFDGKAAVLNLKDWQKGKAFKDGKEVTDGQLDVIRGKAYEWFVNDSFWLVAPYKIFDEGTKRTLATDKAGNEGLMVTYASGGVTPGDSYLWFLDKNGVPTSYKMWVKIIPLGGLEASWENWSTTSSGAKVAMNHKLGPINIKVTNLKTGDSVEAINEKWMVDDF